MITFKSGAERERGRKRGVLWAAAILFCSACIHVSLASRSHSEKVR